MKIEILGTGCAKCKALEKNVIEAVAKSGKFAQIEKVEDITKIMEYGVMSTPGLVIDGKVVSTGKLLSVEEIMDLISSQLDSGFFQILHWNTKFGLKALGFQLCT